jgi:proteasome lid subunit RPN8/RPN11
MNFSIAETICRLHAPKHEVSCSWFLWRDLLTGLRERGRGYSRESGAFLLGRDGKRRKRIFDFILYDDLDPQCLETGIIRFDGRHFGKLWDVCKQRGLMVIGDVHTHPGVSDQSDSDRANPMITQAGHIALIVPQFAKPPVRRAGVGVYVYRGGKRWFVLPVKERKEFLCVGI